MAVAIPFIIAGIAIMGAMSAAKAQGEKAKADSDALNFTAQVARNNAIASENNRTVAEGNQQSALDAGAAARRAAGTTEASGEAAVQRTQLETAQKLATQKAAFAAAGVTVGEGSPLNEAESTARAGGLDALTIRNDYRDDAYKLLQQGHSYDMQAYNFGAQALNFQHEADNYRAQAGLQETTAVNTLKAGEAQQNATFLGGAGKAAGAFFGAGGASSFGGGGSE